jgi:hypothetical protein
MRGTDAPRHGAVGDVSARKRPERLTRDGTVAHPYNETGNDCEEMS